MVGQRVHTDPLIRVCSQIRSALPDTFLQLPDEGRADLACIRDDGHIGHRHHLRLGVLVHGNDELGAADSGGVLDGATDAEGKEYFGPDAFAGLPHQVIMISPPGIDQGSRHPHFGVRQFRQFIEVIEFLFAADSAAAADDDGGIFNRLGLLRLAFRSEEADASCREGL